MTDSRPLGTIVNLTVEREQRDRARLQTLTRRVVSARLYAAWNIGRTRYLIRRCEDLVEAHHRPTWWTRAGVLEDEREPLT